MTRKASGSLTLELVVASISLCASSSGFAVDFQTRCQDPQVVRCVDFDSPATIAGGHGSNTGIFAGASTPALDTTIKASGASSLKFTIPSNSPADTSGSYFANFSSDLSVRFGQSSEFYVQWRQRFSPEFVSTSYAGGGGWKQAIIGTGDPPGGGWFATCTALEVVTQNLYHRGFAQMYNSCTGSTSHGPYYSFEEPYGSVDFKLQNARPSPFCLYSQSRSSYFPPTGNCVGYWANEWMTFQVGITTGPRVNDEFANSRVRLWIARAGQASQLVMDYSINLTAGPPGEDQRFGKVWFLPYNTGKSSSTSYPVAYTWYDELVISRARIADPDVIAPSPPTNVTAQ